MTRSSPCELSTISFSTRNRLKTEVDLTKLKARHDALLPKYGNLWRNLANRQINNQKQEEKIINDDDMNDTQLERYSTQARKSESTTKIDGPDNILVENSDEISSSFFVMQQLKSPSKYSSNVTVIKEEKPSLLNAIMNKQSMSLRVPQNHKLCDNNCNCAVPIIEIDENDGTFDDGQSALGEVLTLSDVESEHKVSFKRNGNAETDIVEINSLGSERYETAQLLESGSDEEPVLVEKMKNKLKPSMKKNDIDFSDSSDIGSGDCVIDFTVKKSSRSVNKRNNDKFNVNMKSGHESSLSNSKVLTDFYDNSSSDEKEWTESSPEKSGGKKLRSNRINTVVILSSDEEECSESDIESGNQSEYTLSDSISGESNIDTRKSTIRIPKEVLKNNDIIVESDEIEMIVPIDKKEVAEKAKLKNILKPTEKQSTPEDGVVTTKYIPKPVHSSKSAIRAFRKVRDEVLLSTFAEFNKSVFHDALSSVEVIWSKKLNTTAGITRIKGKLGMEQAHGSRTATIELATKVIDSEYRLRSTLLHEMCHAAAWLVDGVHKPPHGKCFKKWASISMKKVMNVEVTTTHDYNIAYKYAWACSSPNCNVVIKRHSRSVDTSKYCCGRCKSALIEIEVPRRNNNIDSGYTPKKERKTSEFALFVKSQTADVRKRLAALRKCNLSEVPQTDVMKECGKLWQTQRVSSLDKENLSNCDSIDVTLSFLE